MTNCLQSSALEPPSSTWKKQQSSRLLQKASFKEIFEDPFTEALIKRPLKAIDEKIASLGAFGFCTRYVPGNDDESPLEDLARMLHDLGTTDRLRVDIISFYRS